MHLVSPDMLPEFQGPAELASTYFIEWTPFIESHYLSGLEEVSEYNHFYDSGTDYWSQKVVDALPQGETAMSASDAAKFALWADPQWPLAHEPKFLAEWLEDSWI